MSEILRVTNPEIVLALTAFLCLGAVAWSLRMSCSLCSIEPPDFWQAALTSVIVVAANIILRFWFSVAEVPTGWGTQLVAPLVVSAGVVAASIRIGPISALGVTVVQGVVCAVLYVGASIFNIMTEPGRLL